MNPTFRNRWPWYLLLGAVVAWILLGLLVVLFPRPALAHQAASGMTYDYAECCNGKDCGPIASNAVVATSQGWFVKATGELVPKAKIHDATDGQFHRCTFSDKTTRCLYVPPMSQ